MQINFTKIERIDGLYANVVMSYSCEDKMITRCLNNDELALLNDPLQETYNLDYFSVKFAEECEAMPETVEETEQPKQLSITNGEITII